MLYGNITSKQPTQDEQPTVLHSKSFSNNNRPANDSFSLLQCRTVWAELAEDRNQADNLYEVGMKKQAQHTMACFIISTSYIVPATSTLPFL